MQAVRRETLDNIKGRIAIVEVIGDFVPLKQKGSGVNYWGCCPFHNERTPSFTVNSEKGFYKCFGCGKGGDAIKFLQEKEGMTYLEGMRYLADKYGVAWEEEQQSQGYKEEKEGHERLHILLDIAAGYYAEELKKSKAAQDYLEKRGISDELIKKFQLGYSTTNWQGFYAYAKGQGYSEDILEEAGLLVRKEDKVYDRLRGRITFLLRDSTGAAIGVAGRILDGKGKEAKYINPPETPVYQKSRFLYGLYEGKKAIRTLGNCYLVEGYTDVLALHKAGIEAAVASSGTSLTVEQLSLLRRFTPKVTMLFDGDKAGIAAVLRGIDMLLQQQLEAKVVVLPSHEDPDSYLQQHGAAAFQEYITTQAQDFVTFKMYHLLSGTEGDPEKRTVALQEVMQSLALVLDPIRRGVYIQIASKLSGLSKENIERAVYKIELSKGVGPSLQSRKRLTLIGKKSKDEHDEDTLLYLLFHYGNEEVKEGKSLAHYLMEEIKGIDFRSEKAQGLLASFRSAWENDDSIKMDEFLDSVSPEEKAYLINIMATPFEMSPNWSAIHHILMPKVEEVLDVIVKKNLLRRKRSFTQELLQEQKLLLAQAKSEEEEEKYLARHQDINAIDNQIGKALGNVTLPPL